MSLTELSPSAGFLSRSHTSPLLHKTRKTSVHRKPRRKVSTASARGTQPEDQAPHHYNTSSLPDAIHQFGNEVERFAERLDLWKDAASLSEEDRHRAAVDLVKDYRDVAAEEVDRLKTDCGADLETYQRKLWRRRLNRESSLPGSALSEDQLCGLDEFVTEDIQRWEQEYQTWRLLEDLITIRHPEKALGSPPVVELGNDRFTDDGLEFRQYVHENRTTNERLVIMKWLEECSVRSGGDVERIAEELEERSPQGRALWTLGWMNTREKLKAEKRMRFWNTSLDGLPNIYDSDGNLLIQQLDPDAMTRLNRVVDSQDASFNTSFWLMCFQMLRQGLSMRNLQEWCESCNEDTAAVALGAVTDPNQDLEDPSGVVARYRWRKACLAAAVQDSLHPLEAASFGLLGGDLKSVERSCFDWKDMCYAYLNTQILGHYRLHVENSFSSLLPPQNMYRFGGKMVSETKLSLSQTIEAVRDHSAIRAKNSTHQASSIIQMSLIANTILQVLVEQGTVITHEARQRDDYSQEESFVPNGEPGFSIVTKGASNICKDLDSLRILTHMFLIFKIMGVDYAPEGLNVSWQTAAQNVCTAYIQFLSDAGKSLLIPYYACNLSNELAAHVMARVMTAIVGDHQRRACIEIMTECHMDVVGVLQQHAQHALRSFRAGADAPDGGEATPISLLEDIQDDMWPTKRISSPIEDEPDAGEEVLKACGEWFVLIPANWFESFESLLDIIENMLIFGRLQTAIEFVSQVPPKHVAMAKVRFDLDIEIDVFEEVNDPSSTLNPLVLSKIKTWHHQALMYYHCAQLVEAVQAMWDWRLAEDKALRHTMSRDETIQAREDVLRSIDRVKLAMEPILNPGFLKMPTTDLRNLFPVQNAQELFERHQSRLQGIREAYLPEMVFAYNSALHSAAHLVSRDNFIISLELGKAVSSNDELIRCFTRARRMRELIDSLALTSKAMLKLNELKQHSSKKRGKGPKTLGIWDIKT